jgi:glyoxylase-like metal-dependent hydrolase (beta-lactamase superfamily II)
MMDRRSMLKVVAGAAGAMVAAQVAGRFVRGADGAEAIPGADEKDPLTPELTKVKIGIRKVSEGLFVLLGAGGNIGLLDGKDGVIVIDSGVPERAKDVAAAIGIVSKSPASVLINTHYHFDHVGGNEAVFGKGFRIAAHANVRKRLAEGGVIDFFQRKEEPKPAAALPVMTYDESMTLHANGEVLRLTHYPPPGHTDGDTYIRFEKANVLHTGDLFFNGLYPFIDYSAKGSLDGMIAAEEKLLSLVEDRTKIIPGHGMVCGKADLQKAVDMLKTVRDKIKPLVDAKKTVEEVVAAKPLGVLEGKFSKGFLDDDAFTKLVYMCYMKGT